MVFSSPIFLFLFLPLFLAAYLALIAPAMRVRAARTRSRLVRTGNLLVLISSLLFYFWGETWLTLVMMASTTIDYLSGLALGRAERPAARRLFLVMSICGNLTILAVFKYANFGLDNLAHLLGALGFDSWHDRRFAEIALPLGISFYTFQSMSYTIDVYRRQVRPTRDFLGFATFVTMFPQLVAGPIVRYRDVADQLTGRTLTVNLFTSGVLRFVLGLGKKVLIANTVAGPADRIFALPAGEVTTPLAWLGVVCYTLQIYYDFSGYSDMAIGLGRMLGFRYPENFLWPYAAVSIRDFWRRWHVSLSTWFRDYLYIPLGGSRRGPRRTRVNLVAVFLLCGLWHGAAWVFIAWGLYHGAFLGLERGGLGRWLTGPGRPVRRAYALLVVMGGWVVFRSETLAQAGTFYRALAGFGAGAGPAAAGFLDRELVATLAWGCVFALPVLPWLLGAKDAVLARLEGPARGAARLVYGGGKAAILAAILAASTLAMAAGSYNPFIYFRF